MLHKGCPKCGGDVIVERGVAGDPPEIMCLQCGRRLSPAERVALRKRSGGEASPGYGGSAERGPTTA
jgi:hypothetical protein